MKTKAEFLAMSDDDYNQAILDAESKQCPGCGSFGTPCAPYCPVCDAMNVRASTIPPGLTGGAAHIYVDARRATRG